MVKIETYQDRYFEGVRRLWEEVFPNDPQWNRAELAIPAKTAFQPDLLLIAEQCDEVVGTAIAGYDGHRGWLYTVAVKPSQQRKGIGALLVSEAEQRLQAMGCGKINLQVRSTNDGVVGFYRKLGYIEEDRISMGKRTSP